ncbi:MAG: DUF2318 domain-containing protein, partial [Treponema sp.]|nr:DUF2318 domain-containing protein [Treponema sp.]
MLKYLIQVIQNLLTTAVLIALLDALADKTGGEKRKGRFFFWCCGGSVAALVLAVLRRTTRLINREYINTAVLFLTIICTVFFLVLIWGFRKRAELRERFLDRLFPVLPALLLFYALPTIFLYPAEFLLPGQSFFTTDFLFKLTGFLAGLLVTVLSALALFETAGGLSAGGVKIFLSAALAVNMVNQLSVILQFLLARRLIAVPRWVFRMMVRIINFYDVFLYVILAVSAAIPLGLFIKGLRPLEPGRNPAETRKLRAGRRNRRRWIAVVVCGYAAAVLSLTVVKRYNERGVELTPAEPMTIMDGEVVIPIEKIADGHLHRYNYTAADNIEMRFIVIKKNEAAYGVGLDACDICGPTGYYERKDEVICRLCDVVMNISTIGFKGGCNPVPLA